MLIGSTRITSAKMRNWLMTGLGVLLVGYFVVHTLSGDRGLFALMQLQNQVHQAQGFLSQLQNDNERQERRIIGLRPHSLDPDLLEEESRLQLNLSRPDEVIVIMPNNSGDATSQRTKN